jgi:FMN phosphatase YigB (HAD superfamily)
VAVSFDLFGTLVSVTRPAEPAAAVADELATRGVTVPDDWARAYRERHVEAPQGAEVPLPAHVGGALASRGVHASNNAVRRAVVAAFDPDVETRPDAVAAVEAAADCGPVGVLSNCSVPELATRALTRSALDRDAFDGCGWRKPDRRAFEAIADALSVPVADLIHVGDDARTDGGADDAGGTAVLLADVPLAALPAYLRREGRPCS